MVDNVEAETATVDRKAPALALSGGGFRATLYHCGALIRLNELGYLTKIARISSVSGGSITSGMLAAAWPRLEIENGIARNLDSEVIGPLRAFCRRSVDMMAVGWGAVLPGKSIGDVLADAYDDMFKGITLQNLPDTPQFVFNATNLQTGRLVRMMKVRLADFTIGEIVRPKVRLAVAVAASSAFPPVLSPVEIKVDPDSWAKLNGAVHHGDRAYTRTLSLTDGGAYDNLGLETVDDFNPVIVSDAGAPFGTEETTAALWPTQALRALDIATDQARALRKRLLFAQCAVQKRVPAFSGIDCDPAEYPAVQVLKADLKLTRRLARMRTRLNPFSDKEQGQLINWGWLMMDVAMRSYVTTTAPAPNALPLPKFALV
ncbi:patatin-like phospholipase family protein [Mesorhizobium sp. B2-4-17]|uniref:patatin-like phospholipase family protein n=1 Tax=Mesorhizobium sp. B2-4-17 TaxID=2589932 RepID=UPI00112EB91F|nr:patatin-like phospholipase family protein [Mesorhizobium sp. B2-4-17]TPK87355.1 patatin-like phospholipase family protein [Mesorhizobium sp. B2-4-17]